MDRAVVLNKLESLRRCVKRIQDKTPTKYEELVDDYDLQDIITLNLERCRNTAVHAYQQIDRKIVFMIITKHLGDFREFARQVLAFMNQNSGLATTASQ